MVRDPILYSNMVGTCSVIPLYLLSALWKKSQNKTALSLKIGTISFVCHLFSLEASGISSAHLALVSGWGESRDLFHSLSALLTSLTFSFPFLLLGTYSVYLFHVALQCLDSESQRSWTTAIYYSAIFHLRLRHFEIIHTGLTVILGKNRGLEK